MILYLLCEKWVMQPCGRPLKKLVPPFDNLSHYSMSQSFDRHGNCQNCHNCNCHKFAIVYLFSSKPPLDTLGILYLCHVMWLTKGGIFIRVMDHRIFYQDCLMQKPHFDTSMSYTVYYHLHNKTIKFYNHVHSILLVTSTTEIKRIEARLTQKNWIVKMWYIVKVVSNDSISTAEWVLYMPVDKSMYSDVWWCMSLYMGNIQWLSATLVTLPDILFVWSTGDKWNYRTCFILVFECNGHLNLFLQTELNRQTKYYCSH